MIHVVFARDHPVHTVRRIDGAFHREQMTAS